MRVCWACRKPIRQGIEIITEIRVMVKPGGTIGTEDEWRKDVPFHPDCFEELADRTDPTKKETDTNA